MYHVTLALGSETEFLDYRGGNGLPLVRRA